MLNILLATIIGYFAGIYFGLKIAKYVRKLQYESMPQSYKNLK